MEFLRQLHWRLWPRRHFYDWALLQQAAAAKPFANVYHDTLVKLLTFTNLYGATVNSLGLMTANAVGVGAPDGSLVFKRTRSLHLFSIHCGLLLRCWPPVAASVF